MPSMNSQTQSNLFHYRWSCPVISVLFRQKGAKFITLLNELHISRSVLSSTLQKLMEQDIVKRNPGYGHPLRPEYILTDRGLRLGPFCSEMMACVLEHKGHHLFQSKWALWILQISSSGVKRFSELKSALAPITSRALSEELKLLHAEGFMERKIVDGYPPLATYSPTWRSLPFIEVMEKNKDVLIPFGKEP